MKKTLKRIMVSLLAVTIVISATQMSGFVGIGSEILSWFGTLSSAAEYSGDFSYEIVDNEAVITGYSGDETVVTIPETIDGYNVTSIGDYAFAVTYETASSINAYISYVKIPSGVKKIGAYAFSYCGCLRGVEIPNTVTSIGWNAFDGCGNILSLDVPNSVVEIGVNAFAFVKNVKYSGSTADLYQDWGQLCLNGYVVECGSCFIYLDFGNYVPQYGFVYKDSTCKELCGCAGDLNYEDIQIPDSVETIGASAFFGVKLINKITITDNVTSIGEGAFRNCDVQHIILPNSITYIDSNTFSSSYIQSVTIPKSVECIEWGAFEYCYNLKDVYYTGSQAQWDMIMISKYNNSCLTNATLHVLVNHTHSYTSVVTEPATCKDAGVMTYTCECGDTYTEEIPKLTTHTWGKWTVTKKVTEEECGVETRVCSVCQATETRNSTRLQGYCGENVEYTLDESTGLLTISGTGEMSNYSSNSSPFYNNSAIKTVVVENGVTSIGNYAFDGFTGLTSVTISNSVTSIGDYAFSGCTGLTSITIPDSVTSIGGEAFFLCSGLTSVTIGNGVTSIGEWTFSNCTGLTSITIGNGVTSIGGGAFEYCSGLTSITIPSGVSSIGYDAFYRVNNVVYTGTATGSPWGARCVNGYVDGNLVYADSSKKILCGCSSLATGDIIIPDSVTHINCEAFYSCKGLISVTIGKSVTIIDSCAFSDCTKLTSVTIPDSVTRISYGAFSNCIGLMSITIPNKDAIIDSEAFMYVNNVIYNGTCTGSPWGAKCVNGYVDGNLVYADSSKKILCGCSSLATGSIIIPDSVTSIGINAFLKCRGLTSITISKSVTSIGECAFEECNSLNDVYYTGSQKQWDMIDMHAEYNSYLLNATIHYAYSKAEDAVSLSDTVEIDSDLGIIYGFSANSGLDGFIQAKDDSITVSCNTDKIGTGSVIKVLQNGKEIGSFEAVIFGDTTGDSWYDGQDAMLVNCIANGMLTREQVGEAVWAAADCNHDGVIDENDVEILNNAGLLLAQVDQTASQEELKTSSVYQEYLSLIDQGSVDENEPAEDTPTEEKSTFFEILWTILMQIFDFFKSYLVIIK